MTEKHYRLKTTKADGTPTTNAKIAKQLKETNDKIASGLFGANQKISDGVVGAYKKVENAFTDKFLEEVPDDQDDSDTTAAETKDSES